MPLHLPDNNLSPCSTPSYMTPTPHHSLLLYIFTPSEFPTRPLHPHRPLEDPYTPFAHTKVCMSSFYLECVLFTVSLLPLCYYKFFLLFVFFFLFLYIFLVLNFFCSSLLELKFFFFSLSLPGFAFLSVSISGDYAELVVYNLSLFFRTAKNR